MKKLATIFLWFLFALNSCGKKETIGDPSFCLNLIVSNPAKSLKLSLDIVPHPSFPHSGLMYLHRIQDNSAVIDYRETGVLREHMFDSIRLDQQTFEEFSFLIQKACVWELENVIGQRTDGNAYHFILKDSLRHHTFSLMGMSDNKPLQKLIEFCIEQFETSYSEIRVMDVPSEIDVKRYDHITEKQDSAHIRIVKYDDTIRLYRGQSSFIMTIDDFVELWRILENNHVWDLGNKEEYAEKYPIEYRLYVRRGSRICNTTFFAPSKLSDKRYFNIINSIETLNPSM